jgi:hypothetical protein
MDISLNCKTTFANNCENDYLYAKRILDRFGFSEIKKQNIFNFFKENGGYCDCEIMLNVVWGPDLNEKPSKQHFIWYYSKHTRKQTASYFNVSEYFIRKWAKEYNFTKNKKDHFLNLIFNASKSSF